MDLFPVVLVLAMGLAPMVIASLGWLLFLKKSLRARVSAGLLFGWLSVLVPASDLVRQEYVHGDGDPLWALFSAAIMALLVSGLSVGMLEPFFGWRSS